MATRHAGDVRPPLHLLASESDLVAGLALQAEHRNPVVAAMLLEEIERAELHEADTMPTDAVMLGSALARAEEAPGKGWHWGQEAHHSELPRGDRVNVGTVGPLEEVLWGPSHHTNGTSNMIGALRRAMATTGYSDLKELQRVEVVLSPYLSNG